MATVTVPVHGPISGCTVRVGSTLVARDATVTLPSVTFGTVEMRALGKLEIPLPTQIDAMELSITKEGIDSTLAKLMGPDSAEIQVRWSQYVVKSDGTKTEEGCKAILKCMSKGLPGLSVEVGGTSENEVTLSVSRYQLYVNGSEVCLVDKLAGIVKIGGTSYTSKMESYL